MCDENIKDVLFQYTVTIQWSGLQTAFFFCAEDVVISSSALLHTKRKGKPSHKVSGLNALRGVFFTFIWWKKSYIRNFEDSFINTCWPWF